MEPTARDFSIHNRHWKGPYPVTTVCYKHGQFKKSGLVEVYIKEGKWYYYRSHKRVKNILLLKLLNAERLHLIWGLIK